MFPRRKTETATDVVMRFATLGGAVVTVQPYTTVYVNGGITHRGYAWRCHGCDEDGANTLSTWPDDKTDRPADLKIRLDNIRSQANGHASKCRSMPKPGGAR